MNKIKAAVGGFAVAVMLGAMLPAPAAARHKVDCSKVMDELNSGKKVKEVAKDLNISSSSVRRCARKAKKAGAMASPAAEASPAAAPAPAAPAPAPAPAAPAPAAPAPATH